MACCASCARWIIGIVSACVLICAVVAGVYVYVKEKDQDWSKLIKNNIPFWFILLAACCAVVTSIIGFILCCCKSKCLYVTYLIIIILVILVEIAAIVLAFVFKNKILDGIEENWEKDKYRESRRDLEEKFKCCGFRTLQRDDCGYDKKDDPGVMSCYEQIKDEINHHMKILRICVIIMAAIELVLFICACYLACCNKEEYEIK
ncbi:hypothetical protein M9Y10_034403 [Tritrichomonas musculus]|uniref:Tetraspanin family protein n=1 Tax=Tritrichomonas musculus TaxID=1915356 RepID=A0ABR2KET9_9EUKA